MPRFRTAALAAFLTAAPIFPVTAAGLDAATEARLAADKEAMRKADEARREVLLSRSTATGDRYRALTEFRDRRRKALLDAAEALLAVRGSVPKEEWKAVVAQFGASGGVPPLVEQIAKELPSAVADPARRDAAAKTLADLSAAFHKHGADPESAQKRFLSLLEKKSSTRDDFVSGLEKLAEAQEKLDDKVVDATGALQRTLTTEEWDDLVKRVSPPR